MRYKIINPNTKYAGKKIGQKGEIISVKDIALKVGITEKEAQSIANMLFKKGNLGKAEIKIKEVEKKKKAKPNTDKIEVSNGDNSIHTFE